jgi:hypothetical protein
MNSQSEKKPFYYYYYLNYFNIYFLFCYLNFKLCLVLYYRFESMNFIYYCFISYFYLSQRTYLCILKLIIHLFIHFRSTFNHFFIIITNLKLTNFYC